VTLVLVLAPTLLAACASGSSPSATTGKQTPDPAADPSTATYREPAVGAPGFPRSIYPSPRPGGGGSIPACPAPTGIEALNGTLQARAVVYEETLETRTFTYDLHRTDRAWWSVTRSDWRNRKNWSNSHSPSGPAAPRGPVLYAGSLRGMPHRLGVPPQYRFIRRYCGSLVADDSYAVISGPRNSGTLQGVMVFLNRHDHALLYYEYP
jgi:hypothetical protein